MNRKTVLFELPGRQELFSSSTARNWLADGFVGMASDRLWLGGSWDMRLRSNAHKKTADTIFVQHALLKVLSRLGWVSVSRQFSATVVCCAAFGLCTNVCEDHAEDVICNTLFTPRVQFC